MNKNFYTELSSKDLKDFENKLDRWSELMDKASKDIVNDLSEFGLKEMQRIYNDAQQQYQDSTPMDFSIKGTDYEKTVSMSGEQAIYDEFGTGTIGEENSHPVKDEFGLNPYNSGKTIRRNNRDTSQASKNNIPVGGLYWTYYREGQKIYTQGVPAQKEGYDSLMATIKKAPTIVRKRMKEVLND